MRKGYVGDDAMRSRLSQRTRWLNNESVGAWMVVAVLLGAGCAQSQASAGLYQVTAPLFALENGPVQACRGSDFTYPPQRCSGVEVRGVDIRHVDHVAVFPNGTMQSTTAFQLVGTWDGHALTVREAPKPVLTATGSPNPCVGDAQTATPTTKALALQQRIAGDQSVLNSHGLAFLAAYACGNFVDIVVAVSSPTVVSYLNAHYTDIQVSGWLRPI